MNFTEYDYERMFNQLVLDYAYIYGVQATIGMVSCHLNMDEDKATELVNKIWND